MLNKITRFLLHFINHVEAANVEIERKWADQNIDTENKGVEF